MVLRSRVQTRKWVKHAVGEKSGKLGIALIIIIYQKAPRLGGEVVKDIWGPLAPIGLNEPLGHMRHGV